MLYSRGDLVSQDDVLLLVRPFVSDSTIAIQPRLDILQILEQVKEQQNLGLWCQQSLHASYEGKIACVRTHCAYVIHISKLFFKNVYLLSLINLERRTSQLVSTVNHTCSLESSPNVYLSIMDCVCTVIPHHLIRLL
jgi:hypothetical protein